MKALLLIFLSSVILYSCSTDKKNISDNQVRELVDATINAIELDAISTLQDIATGKSPYKDVDNASLYVFVFNTDLVTVAHPNNKFMTGKSKKGIPDINGKLFRDEILDRALIDGSGWVDYHFENPNSKEIQKKKTYFVLTTGRNGEKYIVCCGKYVD